MSSNSSTLTVSGLSVEFIRKDIRNIHLSILPPEGRVRLSAPMSMTEDNARLTIATRLAWIRKKQRAFAEQERETRRRYVDGETHYLSGHKYLLSVREYDGPTEARVLGNGRIELCVSPKATAATKAKAFDTLYRNQLKDWISKALPKYCLALDVSKPEVRVQKMRTKWGSCTQSTSRVLLNLELAKKPLECFEYILAHELTHLLVRHHSREFMIKLEGIMPDWRARREILNSLPLAYEDWPIDPG